jgi:hypothetical protein
MEKSAKELDFMQAAKLRDEIKHVRTIDLIILLLKNIQQTAPSIIAFGAFCINLRTLLLLSDSTHIYCNLLKSNHFFSCKIPSQYINNASL